LPTAARCSSTASTSASSPRETGARASAQASRISAASSCWPGNRWRWATWLASVTGRWLPRRSSGQAPETWPRDCPAPRRRSPAGAVETQLGRRWRDGVELSTGQWQKLALGRAMMRRDPLLLFLDEPTAALDADSEFRLFERFTAAAGRTRENGGITVLVSHRF